MHPNALFRVDDRALLEGLIAEIGFGTVFAETPDGPRVAHVPLVSTGDGALHFHLARGIVGFEMEIRAWRPTFKLSQNKPPEERLRVADALEAQGSPAIAALMRRFAQ